MGLGETEAGESDDLVEDAVRYFPADAVLQRPFDESLMMGLERSAGSVCGSSPVAATPLRKN